MILMLKLLELNISSIKSTCDQELKALSAQIKESHEQILSGVPIHIYIQSLSLSLSLSLYYPQKRPTDTFAALSRARRRSRLSF